MTVCLQRQDGRCVLTVEDDGHGFEGDLRSQPAGMGLHLVQRLAQQIDSTVSIENNHFGTRVTAEIDL